jgi:hypothetical protein
MQYMVLANPMRSAISVGAMTNFPTWALAVVLLGVSFPLSQLLFCLLLFFPD